MEGVEHPHDTPPYPFMPSPTFGLSSVFGTHHSISEAHLPRYLAEWDFKWNTRKITDGERAAIALEGIEGKRLTYRIPREATHA